MEGHEFFKGTDGGPRPTLHRIIQCRSTQSDNFVGPRRQLYNCDALWFFAMDGLGVLRVKNTPIESHETMSRRLRGHSRRKPALRASVSLWFFRLERRRSLGRVLLVEPQEDRFRSEVDSEVRSDSSAYLGGEDHELFGAGATTIDQSESVPA